MPATAAARSPLWRRVFRTLELRRVDDAIARGYPGARQDLLALRAQTLAGRTSRAPSSAMEALLRWALGAPPSHRTGRTGPARPARHVARQRARSHPAVRSALPALARRHRIDDRDWHPPGARSAIRQRRRRRCGAGQASARCRVATMGRARARALPATACWPIRWPTRATGSAGGPGPRACAHAHTPVAERAGAREPHEPPAGRAHAVDEWDWHAQRFLPGWCTLYEQPPARSRHAFHPWRAAPPCGAGA